jgi:threonine/homoserine/homoserine lactone efflux protein
MFGTHDLALFVVTALVLNATPGADMLYVVTRTLQHGTRAGAAAALGIGAGCAVHAGAAALGLAAVLAATPWAFEAIRWTGAGYLLWLAWGMLRAARHAPDAVAAALPLAAAPAASTVFAQGVLTNVLNPKVALFFLALLPQFIDATAPGKALAFLFLGAIFVVNGTLFLFAVVALAQRARRLPAQPALRRALNLGGAALFAALAGRLALAPR